jgi:hypothetical protein
MSRRRKAKKRPAPHRFHGHFPVYINGLPVDGFVSGTVTTWGGAETDPRKALTDLRALFERNVLTPTSVILARPDARALMIDVLTREGVEKIEAERRADEWLASIPDVEIDR